MRTYGEGKAETCTFCQRIATKKNKQGLIVCAAHQHNELNNVKCACGSFLEQREGKWGVYFHCITCGNISLRKALDMNVIKKQSPHVEMTVRSDDPRFF